MTSTALKEKILHLQAEVGLLMKVFEECPDFAVDEANWKKVKPAVKKARKAVYREVYGKA